VLIVSDRICLVLFTTTCFVYLVVTFLILTHVTLMQTFETLQSNQQIQIQQQQQTRILAQSNRSSPKPMSISPVLSAIVPPSNSAHNDEPNNEDIDESDSENSDESGESDSEQEAIDQENERMEKEEEIKQQEQDEREQELIAALERKHLKLRGDSKTCMDYIIRDVGELSEIVTTMVEMNWFYTKTNYQSILDDLYQDLQDSSEDDSDEECSERFYRERVNPHHMSAEAKSLVLQSLFSKPDIELPTSRLRVQFDRMWLGKIKPCWEQIETDPNNILPVVLLNVVGQYCDIIHAGKNCSYLLNSLKRKSQTKKRRRQK